MIIENICMYGYIECAKCVCVQINLTHGFHKHAQIECNIRCTNQTSVCVCVWVYHKLWLSNGNPFYWWHSVGCSENSMVKTNFNTFINETEDTRDFHGFAQNLLAHSIHSVSILCVCACARALLFYIWKSGIRMHRESPVSNIIPTSNIHNCNKTISFE